MIQIYEMIDIQKINSTLILHIAHNNKFKITYNFALIQLIFQGHQHFQGFFLKLFQFG